jgi:V/A-type H+-transporting ATPase subunit C
MPTSQYASSFGRLQAISLNLLSKEVMQNLMKAKDENEMIKILESTWYQPEIEKAASVFKQTELLEVALNRHLVYINKVALEASPFSGKSAVRAYLSKFTILSLYFLQRVWEDPFQRQNHFLSQVEMSLQEYLLEIFLMTR